MNDWRRFIPSTELATLGASKLHQLDDNLGAVEVTLSEAEVAELDAATQPAAVYPNWFIERLHDQPVAQAMGRAATDH